MFEHLGVFNTVIVTGPNRAGTRLTTAAIAADTGHEALVGGDFKFIDADMLRECAARHDVVIQCPYRFDLMPKLTRDDVAIVCVHRPIEEIVESRGRMFMKPEPHARLVGGRQQENQIAFMAAAGLCSEEDERDNAVVKYEVWARWLVEGTLDNPFDVHYHDLEAHRLWVPPEVRRKASRLWHVTRTE
jgi:hypothetical protein